jgi:2-amino-4-hydroxy-6-hydroxymethyldihydropteridine diphosphokinase / dihydropteroate synthase
LLVLGLGSNLGDRAIQLKRAIARLSRGSGAVLQHTRVSRIYESAALMPAGAPVTWDLPFLNCALLGETSLQPALLLRRIQEIERSLGRPDHERWSPRPIDIDILWWDGNEMRAADLTIPHPQILNRPFVLEPLRDLIPDAVIDGATIEVQAGNLARQTSSPAIHSPEADFQVKFPTLMGILNVTPDSFSDGGRFLGSDAAVAHARQLVADGAGIIDVGAESTRPDGTPVDPTTEWSRLEPVLRGLQELRAELATPGRRDPFKVSLDSRNPSTVRAALGIGVDVLNDVCGFRDPAMMQIAQETEVPLVFMHSLSVPVAKGESLPLDCDPVELLLAWARGRLAEFDRRGIARSRVLFDPGIGFGKTLGQNWEVLEHIERFHDLEVPLLVGHSRKSFLEAVTDRPSADRDEATLQVSRSLATKGVEVLRVHDVKRHADLFRSAPTT